MYHLAPSCSLAPVVNRKNMSDNCSSHYPDAPYRIMQQQCLTWYVGGGGGHGGDRAFATSSTSRNATLKQYAFGMSPFASLV